ncbi:MAG: hypothetical protein AAGD92_01190 [Pseudomonadota bacterium]
MLKTALATAGAVAGILSVVHAGEPSFRYCEAGYARGFVDETASVQFGLLGGISVLAGDGGGGQAACKWRAFDNFFIHGAFRQVELDGVSFPSAPLVGFNEDGLTAREWRIGAGYILNLPGGFAGYGQAAFMRSDYYGDLNDLEPLIATGDASARNGISLEAGLRYLFLNRLEISGYGRWDSEGGYGFEGVTPPDIIADAPGTLVFDRGDDFRGGGQAALRVVGPFWATASYEFGDIDAVFAGVRASF